MDGGIINILKPPGMTSHDIISYIRRTYSIKRVGHAGTLDPAAAGVLPVALGQATRLLEYLIADNKSYRVEMTLGYETDTGDDTGNVVEHSDCKANDCQSIENVVRSFVGDIPQVPPMHSAIKINGKKLYELAREGITVERQSRIIHIEHIELLKIVGNKVLFDVSCSKGTYIRSLCIDIGRKLGCFATMSFLVRTRVGQFHLSDSKILEELTGGPQDAILSPDQFIELPSVQLTHEQSEAFRNGRRVQYINDEQGLLKVYDAGMFVGIGEMDDSCMIKPVKVLSSLKQF
ncbi:tRNA pseudouridine synthase B [bioreactor metagenome]|uniref:tRNA pseudouridine(55) synthase n=1 Tax=bioreactor metagenome TaxID=1076179 RepID=A0A644T3V9_9ZZZZ|nr:tRNA pseudouridine(55) synthase TruB [Negativicutes bacterium]